MNHYIEALAAGTMASKLTLGMLGVFALFVVLFAVIGYLQGIVSQTMQLLCSGLSALIAYFACRSAYGTLIGFCEGKTIAELFDFFGMSSVFESLPPTMHDLFACFEADVASHLVSLPIALVMVPVAFVGLFLIINVILSLVCICVCGILGYTMNNNTVITRWLGVAVAALHGAAVGALVLVPVVGLLNFAGDVAQDTEQSDSTVVTYYAEYLQDAHESPLNRMLTKLGMDKIYSKLCGVVLEEGQEAVDSREPTEKFIAIFTELEGFGEADLAHLPPDQKAKLYGVLDIVGDDAYLADIVSGLLRGFANSELIESKVLGDFDEPFRSILAEWVTLFATTDVTTLKGDMTTILDVFFILSDNGVLSAFGEGNDALSTALTAKNEAGDTVIRQVVGAFESNPRTASFITSLGRLGLTLMMNSTDVGLTEESLETFEDLKEDILTDVLAVREEDYAGDRAAYEAALSDALDTAMKDNGIELDEDTLSFMTSYIDEHHTEIGEFDDMSMNDIILSYFDSYIAATNP